MTRGASYLAAGCALTLALTLVMGATILHAQEAAGIPGPEGDARLEAGVDLRLVLDDGSPEFRTGFSLDLISATRTQRLSFSGDFGLFVPLDDIEAADLNDPSYGIDYLRDNGRSRIELGASLQRQALDRLLDTDPDAPFEEDDLTLSDDGTREDWSLNAAVELGLNDPVGARLSYSLSERIYEDTTDPGLRDRRTEIVGARLRWDLDPTVRLTLDGEWQGREEGDIADPVFEQSEQVRATVGLVWQMLPDLSLDARIGATRLETDTTVFGVTTPDVLQGVDVEMNLTLDRPNGGYGFSASRRLTEPGDVISVALSRNLTLPGGAEIAASAGLTELPGGNIYGTGSLDYDRDTRSGALSFSLSHDAAVNGDDDAVQRTILNAGYRGDLARGARWSLSGRVTNSEYVEATEPDIASARLSLNYVRPLTEDWGLSTGVTWSAVREDGIGDTEESTLFLSLERRFTFRR